MSDTSLDTAAKATNSTQATETATDAEVAEAVDQLVKSVEATASNPDPVTSLTATVATLAESLQSMGRTVEALSARVAPQEPVGEATTTEELEPSSSADADKHDDDGPFFALAHGVTFNLMTLVGIGLFGAGAMQPNIGAPAIAMMALGLTGFVYSSAMAEPSGGLAARLAGSLLTGLGAGLLVGAIPNFSDQPERAALMVPAGIVVLLASQLIRLRAKLALEHYMWVAGIGVWLVIGLAIGLDKAASSMVPAPPPPASADPALVVNGSVPAGDGHGSAAAH